MYNWAHIYINFGFVLYIIEGRLHQKKKVIPIEDSCPLNPPNKHKLDNIQTYIYIYIYNWAKEGIIGKVKKIDIEVIIFNPYTLEN